MHAASFTCRCLRPIRILATADAHHLVLSVDPLDLRRHAACWQSPPEGEPLPERQVA